MAVGDSVTMEASIVAMIEGLKCRRKERLLGAAAETSREDGKFEAKGWLVLERCTKIKSCCSARAVLVVSLTRPF
jgi:hypothetical protein